MSFNHPGIVRLRIEGDLDEGLELVPRARAMLAELQQRMRLGGVEVAAQSLRLGDDAYLTVRIAGGINIAQISTGRVSATGEDIRRVDGVPDFVCGIITNSQIITSRDQFTGQEKKLLRRFVPTQRSTLTHPDLVPLAEQAIERLAVKSWPAFGFQDGNDAGTIEFSQYTHIRPTMYSGRMKQVVQALCGFGRLLPRQRPRDGGGAFEDEGQPVNITKTTSIYARVFKELEKERRRERTLTAYERDVASNGLQIRYDYRSFRTHGIHKTTAGKLYVVEISQQRGVIAMPLPLHPLTVPEVDADGVERWPFREALEALEIGEGDDRREILDEDGIAVLEAFGGFPTGEAFPASASVIEAFIRGGEIARLLPRDQMDPFYRHSFYSSAMGWAFNERGTEAHNTGWRFGDDDVQRGVHYQVSINIPDLPEPDAPLPGAGGASARAFTAASLLKDGAQIREMLARKVYRLDASQLRDLNASPNDEAFIKRLDAIEIEAVPGASANLRLIREGKLWTGSRKNNQAEQMKFYEPLLGYLLSHDFRPADLRKYAPRPADGCDTPMHVFFDGNSFKWVRFFLAGRIKPATTKTENDEDDCAWIGTFTQTVTNGPTEVSAGFYTSDFDDRQELAGSREKTVWVRTYEGPTSIGVGDDPADFRRNSAGRTHRFRQDLTRENFDGERILIGVAVPKDVREAYYIGAMTYSDGYRKFTSSNYETRGDPYVYEGWRCTVSTAGFAFWPSDMQECPPGCQTIRGIQASPNNPRVIRYEAYFPYPCSEFIDTGPWAAKCDNADALKYEIPAPPLPASTSEDSPRKGRFEARYVCAGAPHNKTTVRAEINDASWTLPKFNIPSPDEFGFVQNVTASANALGGTESAVYQRSIGNQVYTDRPDDPIEIYGPYQQAFMRPGVVYIGVV